MVSSNPIFARPRDSIDSADENNSEETPLLYGLASTSPRRPFSTSLYPTLYTRAIALILAVPAFIIFVVHGPRYAASIVFLSFAIARQIVILGSFLGSEILVVRIDMVHQGLKSQEKWVRRGGGLVCDVVVLLGLLVTLAVDARNIAVRRFGYTPPIVTHAVILGFVAFGLLLLSVPDCGMPLLVAMAVAVERPLSGMWKLALSWQFGEVEDEDESGNMRDTVAAGSV